MKSIISLMIFLHPLDTFALMADVALFCPTKSAVRVSTQKRSSLFAIPRKNSFKKQWRKTDVPPLHASTFVQKDKLGEQSNLQSFELDLLEQKMHYAELLNGTSSYTASIHIIEDIESTILKETKSGTLNNTWYSRLLLLLSAALYGTNFTFVKVMNENLPVQDGTILRFFIAALATAPWLFQPIKRNKTESKAFNDQNTILGDIIPISSKHVNVLLAGFEIGCWTGLGYVAQAFGLETTRASTSAFICSLAVVIVPILDLLSGKKPSSRTIIGSLMAVAGVALLELDGISLANIMDENTCLFCDGDLFSLVQPFAFGIGFWRMEHAMKRYPEEAMKMTAVQLTTTAFLSILSCIMMSGFDGLPSLYEVLTWVQNPLILRSILLTGLVNTALTVYLETSAMKTLSATETTMLLSTEPIFGSFFAFQILNEAFGFSGVVGCLMILFACIFSNLNTYTTSKEEIK